ncbi:flagellar export chaperone FliS [Pseudoduganella aquatica]|jgi:flagellar protein FliS|uniref:Flagellar secretion chaperone FliS n=1 Tax=Pseudoduganella aquatica TaxID=2660641 RepID=A0A7X4HFA4_9BURK|nr:flagellar export chaperone FliS [Pseudoduganella aquatica]MYN09347.1 flagellar export chaperone FliS [Pseudoduganella aquatica]
MFGSRQTGVNAYAKVGMETGVVAASPHKLIVMLFDGALVSITNALLNMRSGNIGEKGKAISKAIMIIDSGLRAALDKKVGGEIAEGLDALYEYMSGRLLTANLKNDPAILEEVQRLLTELRDAWNQIGDTPAVKAPATAPTQTNKYASA